MSGWTPGPWEVVEVKPSVYHIMPVNRKPRRVPIAKKDGSRETHPETRHVTHPAEMHLIAAAPDLYEALNYAAAHIEAELGPDHEAAVNARKQMAKARGES